MINGIWFPALSTYIIENEPAHSQWLKIKRLNIFFGANNSGKSRFIRSIVSASAAELQLRIDKTDHIVQDLQTIDSALRGSGSALGRNGLKIKGWLNSGGRFSQEDLSDIKALRENVHTISKEETQHPIFQLIRKLERSNQPIPLSYMDEIILPKSSMYIPILRGLRPISIEESQKSGYEFRTKEDYFKEAKKFSASIYTGETFYQVLKRKLLGEPEGRDLIKKFEKLLSTYFFDDEDVTLIPYEGKDCVHVKIGSEKQFPIFDLGDGLQQCLIITSASFLNADEPSLIMIEEPELSLHPRFLLRLIDFLNIETEHYYFITTHSNALLDLSESKSNVTLNRVSKRLSKDNNEFQFFISSVDRSILNELGIKASSVFLSNCTIWVEGVTDRLYLRCYLEKYLKDATGNDHKFTEGFHYTFVEYAGSNLAHWYFGDGSETDEKDGTFNRKMKAICTSSHPFVVCDGDVKNKGRGRDLSSQGAMVVFLDCKEIDNLVPLDALIYAAKKIFDNGTREKFDAASADGLNKMRYEQYSESSEGMGHLLDKALGLSPKKKGGQNFFSADSGTLKNADKTKLCEYSIEYMRNPENEVSLTPPIIDLCRKIVDHIKATNVH